MRRLIRDSLVELPFSHELFRNPNAFRTAPPRSTRAAVPHAFAS
jgi:hypothetical protein